MCAPTRRQDRIVLGVPARGLEDGGESVVHLLEIVSVAYFARAAKMSPSRSGVPAIRSSFGYLSPPV